MSQAKDSSKNYKGVDKLLTVSLFFCLYHTLRLFPVKWVFQFGAFVGGLAFHCLKSRRAIVLQNLLRVKAWTTANQKEHGLLDGDPIFLTKQVFKRNFANIVSAISLSGRSPEVIEKFIEFESLELVLSVLKRGKGAIIQFPHMGPWELMSVFYYIFNKSGESHTCGALFRPLNNYYFNRWAFQNRSKYGVQLLSKDDGFLKIVRFLKAPSVLLVSHDQRMREGQRVSLFGEEASTSNIFYSLHKMTDAPILTFSFSKVQRAKELKWKFRFYELSTDGLEAEDEIGLLKRSNELLEQVILDSPLDYFFFQNRH
jgi:lauroyl/myristoyl acyltransferase